MLKISDKMSQLLSLLLSEPYRSNQILVIPRMLQGSVSFNWKAQPEAIVAALNCPTDILEQDAELQPTTVMLLCSVEHTSSVFLSLDEKPGFCHVVLLDNHGCMLIARNCDTTIIIMT